MLGRCTRILCEVAALTALALLLLTGVATWRLSQGPVPLNFLTSHVEAALNDMVRPVRVSVQGTNLAWAGWERTLDIRVMGTRIAGVDGATIARIPEMSVSFSLRALLQGVVAPTNLDLIGPRLQVIRSENGNFALTLEETTNLPTDTLGGLLAALSAPTKEKGVLRYLKQVSILDARLVVDDRVTGINWGAPQADFVVIRDDDEIRASLFSDIDAAGKSARLVAKASLRSGEQVVGVDLAIEKFPIDRLAATFPGLDILKSIRVAVSGDMATRITLDGDVQNAKFALTGGSGHLEKGNLWAKDVPIQQMDFKARYENNPASLDIERFDLNIGGPTISLSGSVIGVGGQATIVGRAGVESLQLARLKDFWPIGFGQVARKWVLGNMRQGQVENAQASISVRIPDTNKSDILVDSFAGKLRLRNTTIRYNENFPNLEKVEATAVFAKDRFVASIASGVMQDLSVVSGQVRLLGLDTDKEHANIDVRVSGPLKTALTIANNKPLQLVSKFGIGSSTVKGWSETDLNFKFPLSGALELSNVRVGAKSRIVNALLPQSPLGKPISGGNFDLQVDGSRLLLDGDATVAGTPVKLKWEERFEANRKFVRRYELRGKMDGTARKQLLNLPELAPYVTGPVELDLSLVERLTGDMEIAAKGSLTEADLSIPAFGWRKKPGNAGVAWVSLVVNPDGATDIKSLDIQAQGLRFTSGIRFDKGGKFIESEVKQFQLGRTNISGEVKASLEGGYDVELRGSALDLVPFLTQEEAGEDSSLPRIKLTTEVQTVWFDPEVPVKALKGALSHNGEDWETANLNGIVGKNQPFTFDLKPVGDKRRFTLQAEDAGDILAGLDIADTFRGGKLILTADKKRGKRNPWQGSLSISDYTIVGAPNLARILTLASLTGIVNTLSGKGISFAQLNIPFSYIDGKANISNARAVGSQLGLTAEGTLNLNKKTAAVRGTIVPAYSINSALGNIPLIGKIFTGKKGSGVFAATYVISGDLAKSQITVNPLAALAPGFLRDLIGILETKPKGKPPTNDVVDPN
ncbi:MAG: AsmA-like C-terminal domain-containing protein [Alphaproteobacteria bacterium]